MSLLKLCRARHPSAIPMMIRGRELTCALPMLILVRANDALSPQSEKLSCLKASEVRSCPVTLSKMTFSMGLRSVRASGKRF